MGKYLDEKELRKFADIYTEKDRVRDVVYLSGLTEEKFIGECNRRWDVFFKNPSVINYSRFSTASSLAKELGLKIPFISTQESNDKNNTTGTQREF